MKPGVTNAPPASITSFAGPSTLPTSAITPSLIATSPVTGAPPLPSTIMPPRMTRSNIRHLSPGRADSVSAAYRRDHRPPGGTGQAGSAASRRPLARAESMDSHRLRALPEERDDHERYTHGPDRR